MPFSEKIILVSHDSVFLGLKAVDETNGIQKEVNISSLIDEKFTNKSSIISSSVPDEPFFASKPRASSTSSVVSKTSDINHLKVRLGQTAVKIDTELPKIHDMGIKKIKKKCSFIEADIHRLYAKYKMLVHLSVGKNPNHSIKAGISREVLLRAIIGRVFVCYGYYVQWDL